MAQSYFFGGTVLTIEAGWLLPLVDLPCVDTAIFFDMYLLN